MFEFSFLYERKIVAVILCYGSVIVVVSLSTQLVFMQ